MRYPLRAVCILLTISRTTFVSAIIPGYDCDDVFFPGNELEEVAKTARHTFELDPKAVRQLSSRYEGPPFTEPYQLWPIVPKINDEKRATSISYRVVLNEDLEVFSVIMHYGAYVKECRMRENLVGEHSPYDFACGRTYFTNTELKQAASAACSQMQTFPRAQFPARYNGPRINGTGKQLYVFPVLSRGIYKNNVDDPGHRYVLINSACHVEAAVRKTERSNFVRCHRAVRRFVTF